MTDDSLPPDPMNVLKQSAAQLHEVFLSWVEAGFTEAQACRIIGVMLAENGREA